MWLVRAPRLSSFRAHTQVPTMLCGLLANDAFPPPAGNLALDLWRFDSFLRISLALLVHACTKRLSLIVSLCTRGFRSGPLSPLRVQAFDPTQDNEEWAGGAWKASGQQRVMKK
ncbi:hypothetical protein NDU88_005391 [Pleurodeles waltl]|uniref:Uncharacterized protein n=1 Tax=Pleurodeles waltl TaxID=8319 RepID=A0AAV7TA96_PLEWA|nr:hypothetical protein NDU88_005391 [Pleurodeles waltl]